MIQKTTAYKVSDGTVVSSLEAAQQVELRMVLERCLAQAGTDAGDMAMFLLKEGPWLIDILTTRPGSRPARRKVNGAEPFRKRAKKQPTYADAMAKAETKLHQKLVQMQAEADNASVTVTDARPKFAAMHTAVDANGTVPATV